MDKVIVFDLGGTLMDYKGMPYSWVSYYKNAFHHISNTLNLKLTLKDIDISVNVLTEYNPRINPRDIEYSSEFLFKEATKHWNVVYDIDIVISTFFEGIKLIPEIYFDTLACIEQLKKNGYKVATLTNLPSAMPDRLFRLDIDTIISEFDLYVSSEICGFRKPNKTGLIYISNFFNVPVESLFFVGDEELDMTTAKNANCTSILINRSEENKNYNQDYTINSLNEIFGLVNSL